MKHFNGGNIGFYCALRPFLPFRHRILYGSALNAVLIPQDEAALRRVYFRVRERKTHYPLLNTQNKEAASFYLLRLKVRRSAQWPNQAVAL